MKRFVKTAGAGLAVVFVVLTVWALTIPGPMLREAVNRMRPSILRANVTELKKSGGYVFNNCHNIQGEVPAENIVAMYNTAYACSLYD